VIASVLAGCNPGGPLTTLPDETSCNHGARAAQCMDLPPTRAHDVWTVDGVRAPAEYWGAVSLPLANLHAQAAGGSVYVSVTDPGSPGSTRRVHVFVDEMPVSPNSREVAIYVDAHRFDTGPAGLSTDDVHYVVDLESGTARVESVNWGAGGAFRWVPADARGLEAKLSTCRAGQGSVGDVRVCDLELAFNLPRGYSQPAAGEVEGIGFGLSDDLRATVMPEEMANAPNGLDPLVDRRRLMTLLFRRPEGVPFSFMSWNLAHWGTDFEWNQTGSPFRDVSLDEYAQVMADYDIVAVQEMWSTADARELLGRINVERAKNGLPPDFLYGPVTYDPGILGKLTATTFERQGGVFIYSRFPQVAQSQLIYSACRGEDCFKPKGALWVRLDVSGDMRRHYPGVCAQNPSGQGCPPTPTHELYVDVFDTHLQAGGDAICSEGTMYEYAGACLGIAAAAPATGPLAPLFSTLSLACDAGGLEGARRLCLQSPLEVRTAQLAQLNAFINAVQASSRPHYSIVAGDLNTNGRTLNLDSGHYRVDGCLGDDPGLTGEYGAMLAALGVAADASPDVISPPDWVSAHPEAFDWDIDHGDVAREMDFDWERCGRSSHPGEDGPANPLDGGVGDPVPAPRICDAGGWSDVRPVRTPDAGTLDAGTTDPAGCPEAPCELRSDPRLDYILVRPPALPAEGLSEPPGYLISRARGADGTELPVWQSLWPATKQDPSAHMCLAAGFDPGAGHNDGLRRLSDHAPIVANLELGILREPGIFHPGWPHDLTARVKSINATGETDCFADLCAPLDPYVSFWGHRLGLDGSNESFVTDVATTQCSGWTPSYPVDTCMDDWYVSAHVEPGVYLDHRVRPTLWDSDGLHGVDDSYTTLPEHAEPQVRMSWRDSTIDVFVGSTELRASTYEGPEAMSATDPWTWCTRTVPVSLCLQVDILETRP